MTKTRERLDTLPSEIWDCEACNSTQSMQLRRSSLNTQFYADDILLKCSNCRRVRTHGVPFESPERFREELEARDGRVRDFTEENGEQVAERLEALGYTAKARET